MKDTRDSRFQASSPRCPPDGREQPPRPQEAAEKQPKPQRPGASEQARVHTPADRSGQGPIEQARTAGREGEGLAKALAEFAAAAAGGRSEPICAAYQQLSAEARGMTVQQLMHLADEACGGGALDLVVWAFAHRHCFMCQDGTAECDVCDGAGLTEALRRCQNCQGLGILPCEFCRGTGWADRQTVPPELAPGVVRSQLAGVQADVDKLLKRLSGLKVEDLLKLSQAHRRQVAVWVTRLHARIDDLLALPSLAGEIDRPRMQAIADRLSQLLQVLGS